MHDNKDILVLFLGDFPAERFFADYWRSRFLFTAGTGNHLLELAPSLRQVEQILHRESVQEDSAVRFLSFTQDAKPVYRMWLVRDEAATSRNPREPVNLLQADRFFPKLAPLAQRMADFFGAPPNLQLFYGCEGQGLRPHTDIHDSFVIQIHGRKRWHVANLRSDEIPKSGNDGAALPANAQTYELRPGDVLYKPSHAIHATETVEGPSLSLTASIVTRTAGEVLIEHLSAMVASDPTWLERFPLDPDDRKTRVCLEAACRRFSRKLPSVEALEVWSQS